MRRGNTTKHTFTLPFDVADIDGVHIIYEQGGEIVVKKTKDDCVLNGKTISVTLGQEDTLKLAGGKWVYIQLRVSRKGRAMASEIYRLRVERCLDNEVII